MTGLVVTGVLVLTLAGLWLAARVRRRELGSRSITDIRIDDTGVGKTRADGYTESVDWYEMTRVELVHRYGRRAAPSLRDASLLGGGGGRRGPPGQAPSLLVLHGTDGRGCVLPATDEVMERFLHRASDPALLPGFDPVGAAEAHHGGSLGTHVLWERRTP